MHNLSADAMEYRLGVAVRLVLFDLVEVILTFVLYGAALV